MDLTFIQRWHLGTIEPFAAYRGRKQTSQLIASQVSLHAFSTTRSFDAPPAITRETKLSPALAGFFRSARPDDEMRHFLIGAIEYLNAFSGGNVEVPVSIIRAMNDVDRIAQIEESALPSRKQDVIRYCTLQIARLAGEHG